MNHKSIVPNSALLWDHCVKAFSLKASEIPLGIREGLISYTLYRVGFLGLQKKKTDTRKKIRKKV